MKKAVLFFLVVGLISFVSEAREKSVSLNYSNIGTSTGYWNSGVGLQGKFQLKNRLFLLPDAGYLFGRTKTDHHTDYTFSKESNDYLFTNINLGFSLNPGGYFVLMPYIGVGYYHDFVKRTVKGAISSPSGGGGHSPYYWAEKYSTGILTANVGILAEVYISDNIFFTFGCKYMIDTHNRNGYVPYFNAGVGYSF